MCSSRTARDIVQLRKSHWLFLRTLRSPRPIISRFRSPAGNCRSVFRWSRRLSAWRVFFCFCHCRQSSWPRHSRRYRDAGPGLSGGGPLPKICRPLHTLPTPSHSGRPFSRQKYTLYGILNTQSTKRYGHSDGTDVYFRRYGCLSLSLTRKEDTAYADQRPAAGSVTDPAGAIGRRNLADHRRPS